MGLQRRLGNDTMVFVAKELFIMSARRPQPKRSEVPSDLPLTERAKLVGIPPEQLEKHEEEMLDLLAHPDRRPSLAELIEDLRKQ